MCDLQNIFDAEYFEYMCHFLVILIQINCHNEPINFDQCEVIDQYVRTNAFYIDTIVYIVSINNVCLLYELNNHMLGHCYTR